MWLVATKMDNTGLEKKIDILTYNTGKNVM